MVKRLNIFLFILFITFTSNSFANEIKHYDYQAKTTYSKNDVNSFVYKWFAMFDHQVDISNFKKHLPKQNIVMNFPDFPIRKMADFEKWYDNVKDNIQFNSHDIRDLKVIGNEKNGFNVSFIVNWKATTYDGKSYDVDVAQKWLVKINENREFIISNHKAWLNTK